ncbi:MAG: energy-coupling factor transporter ATPase [Candidatus Borkfalkiaceae bacterium]|nr:energy-coupling factor transporter ATPase [Christensenellaceae bacterium]
MNAIEFTNATYRYPGDDAPVLNSLSFSIRQGSFSVVLGRNGSGKSTAAKLINALILPNEGNVVVLGKDTVRAADGDLLFEIRKSAGMVFQNPDNQQIASIVEDDVVFGPENVGIPREEIAERIAFALEATGTEQFRHAQVSRLSGGQKQRVAIAGVLALRPEIVILDESTSMLDPKGRREVLDVIRKLQKEHGITVIDITHYMDEATDADEAFVLRNGELAFAGTPKELFARTDLLRACGLELPRAAELAKKLNENGVPVGDGILTTEELTEKLCELLQTD